MKKKLVENYNLNKNNRRRRKRINYKDYYNMFIGQAAEKDKIQRSRSEYLG